MEREARSTQTPRGTPDQGDATVTNSQTSQSEYQRGQQAEKIAEHDRRLDAINGSIDRAEETIVGMRGDIHQLALTVNGIGVKVGAYAGIAAFVAAIVGSAASGLIVYAIVHHS